MSSARPRGHLNMRIGRIQCGLVGGERELLLARVAEDLLTATDERVLLESAIALLGDSFGYGMRYVLLHDQTHGDLYYQVGVGPGSEDARGFRTKLGVGLTGTAAATREIVNVGDVGADARFIATTDCVSEICVPLLSGADLIGVLSIQSPKQHAFGPDDERLLSAFATLCALAIGRVRRRPHAELRRGDAGRVRGRARCHEAAADAHDRSCRLRVPGHHDQRLDRDLTMGRDPPAPACERAGVRAAL